MTDQGLQYISVARCGNYWVYLGYATDILDNYTDANGNVDINAAVNDGAMNNLGTYTDPNSGQSQTVYGDNGVMNEDQMVNSGFATQEDLDNLDDIFDNW